MRFSAVLAVLLPVGAALAQSTIVVKVGENGTLTYDPPSVNATNGDTIAFQFLSKNHTVTQSTFATPCSNLTNADGTTGIDSGFQFVQAGATEFPQWSFTMTNVSTPLWFYCRQTQHCELGMVFAVNPTAAKSYDAFKAAAMNAATGSSASASGSGSGFVTSTARSATGTASPSATATGSTSSAGAVGISGAASLLTVVSLLVGIIL